MVKKAVKKFGKFGNIKKGIDNLLIYDTLGEIETIRGVNMGSLYDKDSIKVIDQRKMTSECWMVQFNGFEVPIG